VARTLKNFETDSVPELDEAIGAQAK
jgi:hypothetical protein